MKYQVLNKTLFGWESIWNGDKFQTLEEAKTQLQSGKAVISNLDEDDNVETPAVQLHEENTETSDADDSIADDSILDDTQDTE